MLQVTSVECEPPESPVNGKAIYTSIAYNSVVSYECKTGFTIVGASTRRCGADAKWTGHSPTCREINCGPPGVLYNGWIDNIENGYVLIAIEFFIIVRIYSFASMNDVVFFMMLDHLLES